MNLSQRTVLVTGATSGIGRATAIKLAEYGARIIATGRDTARIATLSRDLGDKGQCLALDVSQPAAIAELMDKVGAANSRLHGLVINAAVSPGMRRFDQLDPTSYDNVMDVNVKGAVFTFLRASPLLADGASVVFIGSTAGRKGGQGNPLYAGSKGFIRSFARALGTSPDIIGRKIRVNVVSPGPIETPMNASVRANADTKQYVAGLVPMGRWGQAEEVAEAIAFLLSPLSSFTTGAELTVDGGMAHV